ncbi:hypothetical protein [Candidatus Palauibacter sp.]|uniref:hypothetical protein n=1 Tax=Candidatus Palauibacter sp. TaxID=3101350 RepID=UPI003B5957B3
MRRNQQVVENDMEIAHDDCGSREPGPPGWGILFSWGGSSTRLSSAGRGSSGSNMSPGRWEENPVGDRGLPASGEERAGWQDPTLLPLRHEHRLLEPVPIPRPEDPLGDQERMSPAIVRSSGSGSVWKTSASGREAIGLPGIPWPGSVSISIWSRGPIPWNPNRSASP